MPDFTLRAPDREGGGEYVTGDPQDRALLLARGYRDITDTADTPASSGDTTTTADPAGGAPEKPTRSRVRENPAPGVEVPPNAGK